VAFRASERARLARVFPDGVCDWARPGVDQRPPAGTLQRFGP
jgi:hypothetical protein